MFRKLTNKLSKGGGLLLAVMLAAIVGGATTAIVTAAIPSSNGTISACYGKINGNLRVIDAESGKTCNGLENPLSWSSSGSGGAVAYAHLVHDNSTDTYSLDASRSKNVTNFIELSTANPDEFSPGSFCLTLNQTPHNVATAMGPGGDYANAVIKDQNGWTGQSQGSFCDQYLPGSNVYLDVDSGANLFATFF